VERFRFRSLGRQVASTAVTPTVVGWLWLCVASFVPASGISTWLAVYAISSEIVAGMAGESSDEQESGIEPESARPG
jgi:hypothetical protein